jgi:hypothetical protein
MKSIFRLALALLLVLSLAHLSAGPASFNVVAKTPTVNTAIAFQQSPRIAGASVKGKKLIVTGADFSSGAVLMINGEKQKTKNDGASPTTMLIVKKGGKKIRDGEVTSLRVENAGGALSNEFGFFDGPTVTLEDGDKVLTLRVGDRFLLFLKSPDRTWEISAFDSAVIKKVADAPLIEGAQGVFEAVGRGQTELVAAGLLPCHKADPPCMALTLGFVLKIAVE